MSALVVCTLQPDVPHLLNTKGGEGHVCVAPLPADGEAPAAENAGEESLQHAYAEGKVCGNLELLAQRDALRAQVEALTKERDAWMACTKAGCLDQEDAEKLGAAINETGREFTLRLAKESERLRAALFGLHRGLPEDPCFCSPNWEPDNRKGIHAPYCIAARAALKVTP